MRAGIREKAVEGGNRLKGGKGRAFNSRSLGLWGVGGKNLYILKVKIVFILKRRKDEALEHNLQYLG